MMRSMYSGVSGLKNHQVRMDVIGNNIANINTAGYKKSRVVFKDTLYQSMKGATGAVSGSRGGTNPMGIGLGMAVSSVDQIHTAAATTVTNRMTDMAVDGNGYFVLKTGEQDYYTRCGNFDFDEEGMLTNVANGYNVQGWLTAGLEDPDSGDWIIDTNANMRNIDISGFKKCDAKTTTEMTVTGNLYAGMEIPQVGTPAANIDPTDDSQYPSSSDDTLIVSRDVYDSVGRPVTVNMRFFKTGMDAGPPALTNWACDISLDSTFDQATGYTAADFTAVDLTTATEDAPATGDLGLESGQNVIRIYNLQFDEDGKIQDPENSPWLSQVKLTIERNDTTPVDGAMAQTIEFTVDLNEFTQYDSDASGTATQNGYKDGSLISYNVGTDGTIKGIYDNGESKSLARVALATFENPGGLNQVGGTLFQKSSNSGVEVIAPPGESGKGDIIPNSLEMSNVDLSEEFTDMITTQRGFQANSRIITTSDEMIQELVNLKR
ncbi:MAG: flagellar hook protein FlgE [Syntrophomonadaceae bacterium]|nr:flagellar hook protein FlgE [Syntrophomonadaceae bacterium]